jgi:hypothetical protein
MKRISFVASRYKEKRDVSDMSNVINFYFPRNEYQTKLVIYDKCEVDSSTYKFVSNVGRETYAWFDYVLSSWDNLDDYCVFIHPCSLLERQDKFLKFVNLCKNMSKLSTTKNEGLFSTGEPHMFNFSYSYSRKFHHVGNTVANADDVRKQEFIPTSFSNIAEWWSSRTDGLKLLTRSTIHGMCGASKENLKSWGNEFWQAIFNDINDGGANGEISHFLERAMYSIAAGKHAIQKFSFGI